MEKAAQSYDEIARADYSVGTDTVKITMTEVRARRHGEMRFTTLKFLRLFMPVFAVLMLLSVLGCGTCVPSTTYLDSEKVFIDFMAKEYLGYVESDAKLDSDAKRVRRGIIQGARDRNGAARKVMAEAEEKK
jgi:hypothetical protein